MTALTPVHLLALGREDFLAAVTSHAQTARAAGKVVSDRLAAASALHLTVRESPP